MPIRIEPLDGPIGALVHGLHPRQPVSDADFAAVEKAMFDHIAIVIPDLEENVPWLHALGRRFGPLVPHVLDQYHHPETPEISIIARNDSTKASRTTGKPAGAFWHSDLSYEREPSDAIFLYAQRVPDSGGDTMVANMALAYETLPEATKRRIEGLTATHRWGWNTGGATPKLTPEQQAAHPDVVHPVVRPHPRTGRKVLFVNPGYTMRINELPAAESDTLLADLFEHALQPDFQYRHSWAQGMLLGLDNRSSMHCAVDDYTGPRRMLRMIVGNLERTGH
ncbi:MAG TPA: TauD/TfdA family dioxygenase [Thermohalobaculum sp.]|nr:TauD/TfdA family dioxygenase [Thermohalobaculum sp.]